MKNYKNLVPIALVVVFLLSIYMVYSSEAKDHDNYKTSIEAARKARSMEIWIDAETAYKEALNIFPSLELSVEIGQFYEEQADFRRAMKWGEETVDEYPTEPAAYEFLIALYSRTENYLLCFDYAEQMRKRQVSSEIVDKIMDEIEYTYFINEDFDEVGTFSDGYCAVKQGEKWGYIDTTGKKMLSAAYQEAGIFIDGLAPIVDLDGAAYFIDKNGNKKQIVTGVDNVVRLGWNDSGLYALYNGKNWGFYNNESQHLFGAYEAVTAIANGYGAVMNDGKWSIVNREGVSLSNEVYEAVAADDKQIICRNNSMFVCQDGKYYMLDTAGNKVSEAVYEDARIFNDATYAAVKKDGAWGFIDNMGNVVIDFIYEDARSFSNGLAAVKSGELWGYIDLEGNMVIEPQFADAKDFNNGGSVLVKAKETKWSLLRLNKYSY